MDYSGFAINDPAEPQNYVEVQAGTNLDVLAPRADNEVLNITKVHAAPTLRVPEIASSEPDGANSPDSNLGSAYDTTWELLGRSERRSPAATKPEYTPTTEPETNEGSSHVFTKKDRQGKVEATYRILPNNDALITYPDGSTEITTLRYSSAASVPRIALAAATFASQLIIKALPATRISASTKLPQIAANAAKYKPSPPNFALRLAGSAAAIPLATLDGDATTRPDDDSQTQWPTAPTIDLTSPTHFPGQAESESEPTQPTPEYTHPVAANPPDQRSTSNSIASTETGKTPNPQLTEQSPAQYPNPHYPQPEPIQNPEDAPADPSPLPAEITPIAPADSTPAPTEHFPSGTSLGSDATPPPRSSWAPNQPMSQPTVEPDNLPGSGTTPEPEPKNPVHTEPLDNPATPFTKPLAAPTFTPSMNTSGNGEGGDETDGDGPPDAEGEAPTETMPVAEQPELSDDKSDAAVIRASELYTSVRRDLNAAFERHNMSRANNHLAELQEATDVALWAYKRLVAARERNENSRYAAAVRSAAADGGATERAASVAVNPDEAWADYLVAATEHAEALKLQRAAFAEISRNLASHKPNGNLDSILPTPYETYLAETSAAHATMIDVGRRYLASLPDPDTEVSELDYESNLAPYTLSDQEIWTKFRQDYETFFRSAEGVIPENGIANDGLSRQQERAWAELEASEQLVLRSLSSYPFLPVLRETITDGLNALVVKTGDGTVVKVFRTDDLLGRGLDRHDLDDGVEGSPEWAKAWSTVLDARRVNSLLARDLVDLHNWVRQNGTNSEGERIGHLVPEHRMRADIPDGFEMDEIPFGEPGYLRANQLSPEAYQKAFYSLVPIFIGLESQGITTDFNTRNLAFDEQGKVTAVIDLVRRDNNAPLSMPNRETLENILAHHFTEGVPRELASGLLEHLESTRETDTTQGSL